MSSSKSGTLQKKTLTLWATTSSPIGPKLRGIPSPENYSLKRPARLRGIEIGNPLFSSLTPIKPLRVLGPGKQEQT